MEEQLSFSDYLQIARRRWKLLATSFLLLLAGAVTVAAWLPPTYRASGLILVEAQQIPDELIRSTVTSYADERIALIQQRVMTRDNLLRIIEKFDLFPGNPAKLPASGLLDAMRKNIIVELVDPEAFQIRRQGSMTMAFRVGFDHSKPEIALKVANELVTLFLEENVRSRTERAVETTAFITEEAEKLRLDLEKIEEQLAAAKQKHSNALPENLDLHRQMLDRAEADDREAAREIKALESERRFLELELAAVRRGGAGTVSSTPAPAEELARMKAELAAKRGVYSSNHPDLKYLERKVAALAEQLKSGSAESDQLGEVRVQARIAAADARLASLAAQREMLKSKVDELQGVVIQTPQVQRELQALERDHANALRKYQELKDKQLQAKFAESLEEERKAERFSLLEPPVLPDAPIKPDRRKALAIGVVLAFAGSGGSFMLVESLDQTLRGPKSLSAILHQAPLVRIPYIETRGEVRGRRRKLLYALLALLVLVLAAVIVIHFMYMPLDLIWSKILARLG